jgi:GNAT superfamily N-acetyltransferase
MTHISIRPAKSTDVATLMQFICELAEYEKLRHEVVGSEDMLAQALFGNNPKAFAVIAEKDGDPAGFALFFYNFSTFLCQHGLYIEDIYVRPAHRGMGIGKKLLVYLAQKAVAEGCGRLEWWVLDWNEPALAFYASIGANPMNEWTVQRVTGKALNALASEEA